MDTSRDRRTARLRVLRAPSARVIWASGHQRHVILSPMAAPPVAPRVPDSLARFSTSTPSHRTATGSASATGTGPLYRLRRGRTWTCIHEPGSAGVLRRHDLSRCARGSVGDSIDGRWCCETMVAAPADSVSSGLPPAPKRGRHAPRHQHRDGRRPDLDRTSRSRVVRSTDGGDLERDVDNSFQRVGRDFFTRSRREPCLAVRRLQGGIGRGRERCHHHRRRGSWTLVRFWRLRSSAGFVPPCPAGRGVGRQARLFSDRGSTWRSIAGPLPHWPRSRHPHRRVAGEHGAVARIQFGPVKTGAPSPRWRSPSAAWRARRC